MADRPPFIVCAADAPEHAHTYPHSSEAMGPARAIGRLAGLRRIGLHRQRLPPGTRSSWPHAESLEEEFVYVLEGTVDAWIDGTLHRMQAGDLAAFPSGTGVCHCFLNNSEQEAVLLVGGEANQDANRIYYPLHPARQQDLPPSAWWSDVPRHAQGPHDGLPDRQRTTT